MTGGLAGDRLMVELLSGQAQIEAKDYKVLEWDEMQKLKKVSRHDLGHQPAGGVTDPSVVRFRQV